MKNPPHLWGGVSIENGLIINKTTHEKITQLRINNENELLQLYELEGCQLLGMRVLKDWGFKEDD